MASDVPQFDFAIKTGTPIEIRQTFQRVLYKLARGLGNMSLQNKEAVNIIGGTISGTDIDVRGATLLLDDNQVALDWVASDSNDINKVITPDGSGGLRESVGGTIVGLGADRVVENGETRIIVDTYSLVLVNYMKAEGTGAWKLEGDGAIRVLKGHAHPVRSSITSDTTLTKADKWLSVDSSGNTVDLTLYADAVDTQMVSIKINDSANTIRLIGTVDGNVNPAVTSMDSFSIMYNADISEWEIR